MAAPIQFDIARSGFSVRLATASDAQALRMLLPELGDAAIGVVALDRRWQLVIGAAAVTRSIRREPLAGPGVGMHVIAPCRRSGVGASLLEHVEQAARSFGAQALYGAQRVDLDSDDMTGWGRLGFRACATVEEHTLPLDEFEPRLAPVLARLREQARIPDEAAIVPLYRANLDEVLKLHMDFMGGDRDDLTRRLRGEGTQAFHPRYSRVLVIGDQTMGCILAHRAGEETAIVDANILNPRVRGGWANVWLKLEATRGALSLGIRNFQFMTFDHYADTRVFTKKLSGMTTRTTVLMMRSLR